MKRKKSKLASPKVRKFARELGANIVEIQGSQRSGRVNEEDVKNFVKKQFSDVQNKDNKQFAKNEINNQLRIASSTSEGINCQNSLFGITMCSDMTFIN